MSVESICEKRCTRCGEVKALGQFPAWSRAADGHASWCRPCKNAYGLEVKEQKAAGTYSKRQRQSSEAAKAKKREWIERNREAHDEYHRRYRQENKAALTVLKREGLARARREGIAAYGGCCECCGEADERFLTIDHINGRTTEPYRITGVKLFSRLRRLGFPRDNFRLLCFNCNCARGIYGECPHETKRKAHNAA